MQNPEWVIFSDRKLIPNRHYLPKYTISLQPIINPERSAVKPVLSITLAFLSLAGCKSGKEAEEPQSSHDIRYALSTAESICNEKSLDWLSGMLDKAEEDRTVKSQKGQYIGRISIIPYNGRPVFYTDFGLGSGGIAFHLFDCKGSRIIPEDPSEAVKLPGLAALKANTIYSSISE